MIVALYNLQLLLYRFKPVIRFNGFSGVREHGRICPMELAKLVPALRLGTFLLHQGHIWLHCL